MARNDAKLGLNTTDWDKGLSRSINNLNSFVNKGMAGMNGLAGSVGKLAGTLGIAVSAVQLLKSNVETAMNFEKSMSSLKALTGMGEADMNTLKNAAIELGGSSTQTASQVADAFKLIGSAKPELLSSTAALKQVTKDAITLAEAAGMEVPDAAKALTTSLNQMGVGASQSARFINVLAAASQKGAGDINWLNEAITQSGTAAKAVGTEYEELVANLEQLAQGGYDASSAGTALRSIIMNLEKQGNKNLKPSVVGLTTAFSNLGKECKTLSDYQSIAGKQFASQAKILADNATNANAMKNAITGTNTAMEQAKINTDNFSGSCKSLGSAWEALNLHVNDSNGFLKWCVDGLTEVVKWMDSIISKEGAVSAAMARMNKGDGTKTRTQIDVERYNAGENVDDIIAEYLTDINKETESIYEMEKQLRNIGVSASQSQINIINQQITQAKNNREALKRLMQEFQSQVKIDDATTSTTAATSNPGASDVLSSKSEYTKKLRADYYNALSAGNKEAAQDLAERLKAVMAMSADEFNALASETDPDKYAEKRRKLVATIEVNTNKVKTTTAKNNNLSANYHDDTAPAAEGMSHLAESIEDPSNEIDRIQTSWDKLQQSMKSDSVSTLAGAFSSLGASIGGAEGQMISFVGTMAQQIAAGVMNIANLKAQEEEHKAKMSAAMGDAAAEAMAAHSSIPFVGVALGVAAVATIIATLMSLPKFATGGIVGGNSYEGDKLLARVNSGEAILNTKQQARLNSMLDNAGSGRGESTIRVDIKNDKLTGTLRNAQGRSKYTS